MIKNLLKCALKILNKALKMKDKITPPLIAGIASSTLALIKLVFGLASGSVAVLSSAADSLSDTLISIINYFALKKSRSTPNARFNFGFGKLEALSALTQSLLIIAAGLFVAYSSIENFIRPRELNLGVGMLVMIISIIITACLVLYLRRAAIKYQSLIIRADALNYEADLITNAATLLALLLVWISGFVIIDVLFGLALSAYIIFKAGTLAKTSIYDLLDEALNQTEIQQILDIIKQKKEIINFHSFRTRKSGNINILSVHLEFVPDILLLNAHEVSKQIENEIKSTFGEQKWIFEIHFDTDDDSADELYAENLALK